MMTADRDDYYSVSYNNIINTTVIILYENQVGWIQMDDKNRKYNIMLNNNS